MQEFSFLLYIWTLACSLMNLYVTSSQNTCVHVMQCMAHTMYAVNRQNASDLFYIIRFTLRCLIIHIIYYMYSSTKWPMHLRIYICMNVCHTLFYMYSAEFLKSDGYIGFANKKLCCMIKTHFYM